MGRLLREFQGEEVHRTDYAVLVHLSEWAGGRPARGWNGETTEAARSRELATRVGLDQSTMSRRLTSLAQRGLITREPDPCDRRAHVLLLTELGAATMTRERARRVALITDALDNWEHHDREELARLLSQLTDTLEARESSS